MLWENFNTRYFWYFQGHNPSRLFGLVAHMIGRDGPYLIIRMIWLSMGLHPGKAISHGFSVTQKNVVHLKTSRPYLMCLAQIARLAHSWPKKYRGSKSSSRSSLKPYLKIHPMTLFHPGNLGPHSIKRFKRPRPLVTLLEC